MPWSRSECRWCRAIAWPGPPWAAIDLDLAHRLASKRPVKHKTVVRDVLETAPTATSAAHAAEAFSENPDLQSVVLLGDYFRPVSILDADSAEFGVVSPGMRVNLDTPLNEALARSVTRTKASRFEPLLVTDNAGRYVGVARLERMITALTEPAG